MTEAEQRCKHCQGEMLGRAKQARYCCVACCLAEQIARRDAVRRANRTGPARVRCLCCGSLLPREGRRNMKWCDDGCRSRAWRCKQRTAL
jgi:hypothetical protein